MRTEKEIKKMLKEYLSDEILKLPNATIDENASLALTQLVMETTISTLKWVLNEKK